MVSCDKCNVKIQGSLSLICVETQTILSTVRENIKKTLGDEGGEMLYREILKGAERSEDETEKIHKALKKKLLNDVGGDETKLDKLLEEMIKRII